MNRISQAVSAIVLTGALAGCPSDRSELQSWMNDVRKTTKPDVQKVEEPKRFEPFRYAREQATDPFARTRLAGFIVDDEGEATPRRGGAQPDLARQRELLESFPLDTIRMVGHMTNGRQNYALVQVENMVHQLRVGQHAGQDFGRVVRVNESEVQLKEMVQDAAGDWVQRDTTLKLQEGAK